MYICPNWQRYLSKLTNVFVQIDKCICQNWQMYFFQWGGMLPVSPLPPTRIFPVAKYICSNCKLYLSKLLNVFVQMLKCICPNGKIVGRDVAFFSTSSDVAFSPSVAKGGKWFTRDQRGQEVANYCATVSTELLSLCNRVNRIIIIVQPCQQNYYHYATVSTEFPDSIKK